jgi:signal transduction histidine kinase
MKLSSKITFFVLITLIFLLSIFTYVVIKDEKKILSSLLAKQGTLLTNIVSAASVEIILVEDYPLLDSYLINISNNYDSISFIKIIKDEKVVSSIENKTHNFKEENIKVFSSNIEIDSDLLGVVELGLTTSKNKEIINKRIEQFLILIVIISIFLFIILLYIIKHFLLKYIEKLKTHTKLIGDGEYSKTLNINTKDEFEELATSINTMSKNIYESHTNLKQLTIIQEQQKQELIEANKSKDDFLANMSHELKTPLNSINVISSVMMKNKKNILNEEQVKNLNIINHCGNDLLFLINDVLDISKLEAGKITLDNKTFNLYKMISNIKDMFEPQIINKQLEFIFEYNEKVQNIYSDKQRIKQIVKNLLSNSLKFVHKGSIKLIINDLGKDFNIIVQDDGIGIDEEKLKHIFDRFKQADASTTRKYGGTGLGLAISKELTSLLEGSLEVKSKENIGTIFTLTLPKNIDKIKEYDVIKNKTIENNSYNDIIYVNNDSQKNDIKKETILILNNDPISFMSLVIELKKDYFIEQVDSFVELVTKIKDNEYISIIIDITKVNQNDLKKILKHIQNKLILISTDEQQVDEEITDTAEFYFIKPLNVSNIITNIHTIKDKNGKI